MSISLVVIPLDIDQITEDGAKALFSASSASPSTAADAETQEMLRNKLLFCACSVAGEISTNGLLLSQATRNSATAKSISADTIITTDRNDRILFECPLQGMLLAVTVPERVFLLFGRFVVQVLVQALLGLPIKADEAESGTKPGKIPSGKPRILTEVFHNEVSLTLLQHHMVALMQSIVTLSFAPPATPVALQVSHMTHHLCNTDPNQATGIAQLHAEMTASMDAVAVDKCPLSVSVPDTIQRYVACGVSVWERGRLLFSTASEASFTHKSLPCALLTAITSSASDHQRNQAVHAVGCKTLNQKPSRTPFSGGYIVPGTGVSPKYPLHELCLVVTSYNLVVAQLLKPSSSPYNGSPLETIQDGLASFLALRKGTVLRQSHFPYMVNDVIDCLNLPSRHPLVGAHEQMKLICGIDCVLVGRRECSKQSVRVCVESPSVNSVPDRVKVWLFSNSVKHRGASFTVVSRTGDGKASTEGYSTIVVGSGRSGDSKKFLLHVAIHSAQQLAPPTLKRLTQYVVSRSW